LEVRGTAGVRGIRASVRAKAACAPPPPPPPQRSAAARRRPFWRLEHGAHDVTVRGAERDAAGRGRAARGGVVGRTPSGPRSAASVEAALVRRALSVGPTRGLFAR